MHEANTLTPLFILFLLDYFQKTLEKKNDTSDNTGKKIYCMIEFLRKNCALKSSYNLNFTEMQIKTNFINDDFCFMYTLRYLGAIYF